MATERAAFPTDPDHFNEDDRVSFDQVSQSYKLEDEGGEEWEWLDRPSKWVPTTDEAMIEQQQQAYRVQGVDESEPAVDPRKRKAGEGGESTKSKSKKQKPEEQPRKNNAIYVSSLPLDVDEKELHEVFSRFGVIAESADSDKKRIKLYTDDDGQFKGDALIVYFRPESVPLAINMLDETDFRIGQKAFTGPMRVKEADQSYKSQKEQPLSTDQAKKKGSGANRDRNKVIKKNQEMNSRLADWDDDDPQALPETSRRWDKVVVLKQMFTQKEIAEDPNALKEIEEDVREECDKFGTVVKVMLYDKEEDGVVTVRFEDATAAGACIKVFDGRWYDGRKVEAFTANGEERFKKSKKQNVDNPADEEQRLEQFSNFIEGQ